ncbi:ASCH domain-containing protein [Bacteriovoracaceae bacterium]|nr:ASCH domain-containing protein [Bacteriovoracaceae bacterium]
MANFEELFGYWNKYLDTLARDAPQRDVEFNVSMFGGPELADDLAALIVSGKKTAGSGLVKDYEVCGDELPALGNYTIVLNSDESPVCITHLTKTKISKFKDVGEDVAIAEGEGDLSLEYWRNAHVKFFTPSLIALGIKDLDHEDVITEFFEVVFSIKN